MDPALPSLRQAEPTCLLIADISGYTGYLTSTELEHAQDVIADFIETVIKALEPTFQLIETEGDAVFVVAPLDGLNGQIVLDIVDACYFTFRRHSRSVVRATTCTCNACRQIPTLDLKFVIHGGPVVRAPMGRRENVTGPAVIAAHRLLKNSVKEVFGPHAYLLMTEEAMTGLGLDREALRCKGHRESYEHVGEIAVAVFDLEERWLAAEARSDLGIAREDAAIIYETDIDAPAAAVWDALHDPRKRLEWSPLTAVTEEGSKGRRDLGTVVHCAHGPQAFTQELLEWRPFERYTQAVDFPGLGINLNTVVLSATASRTHLEHRFDHPRGPIQEQAWPQVSGFLYQSSEESYGGLRRWFEDKARS